VKKNIFNEKVLPTKDIDINKFSYLQNAGQNRNVDINMLLNRVKVDQLIEKKKRFIFFSLGILLLALMGTFLSIIK
jgi:hypothetical protein|tara:strand:- start:1302 stop:1529 length:228 start_codon:yes stop_codon:yes gene_type:complete